MLYEDVDFKTLSDRYSNSRMVPFLTHTDGVRANLFSVNPRQKNDPHYGKSTVVVFLCVFTVKLDATNSFPSNTAEVRPIYLKIVHIMRKPVLSYVNNKDADQPAHPRSLISAFVFRFLDSNEILELKAI